MYITNLSVHSQLCLWNKIWKFLTIRKTSPLSFAHVWRWLAFWYLLLNLNAVFLFWHWNLYRPTKFLPFVLGKRSTWRKPFDETLLDSRLASVSVVLLFCIYSDHHITATCYTFRWVQNSFLWRNARQNKIKSRRHHAVIQFFTIHRIHSLIFNQ